MPNTIESQTFALHKLKIAEPLSVKVPRVIFGDVTPEKLGHHLATEWPSAGVLSSEAGIVFGAHGMNGESAMRNMALINVMWDGGFQIVDRRTSESYRIQDARLTMGLAVQANTMRNFFNNSRGMARGTGFLARFLIAWPATTQGTRFFKEPPSAWPKLSVFSHRITELLDTAITFTDAGGINPITLDFSVEAKAAWVHFYNQVEQELRRGGDMSDTKDVASKAADNVARLAALFHLFEQRGGSEIQVEFVKSAIVIVTWHLYEANRFLYEIAMPENLNNAIKLDEFILRYCRDNKSRTIAKNYIRQNGPVRDKKLLNDGLDELAEANRIRVILDGRTSIVEVNPALLGDDNA